MTIDVIEVPDGAGSEMVRRVPSGGSGEFQFGAQVIVRESQTAIFFRDGKCYDTFGPGRHTLSTLNMPLLGGRITDRIFGESPFKAEVYFVNQNSFLNLKWGTHDPIAYRDRELSLVRLRARGELAVRISDPVLFVNKVVGARGLYAGKELEGFLKSIVLSSLAQVIGAALESIFDLPVRYDELATATKARVFDEFAAYGTELTEFIIEAITPPDEVQARIDERSGIGAVGDLGDYLRYKSALALGEAATNTGGVGSALDAAAGLGLGMSVMRSAQDGTASLTASSPSVISPQTALGPCIACGHAIAEGSKFCSDCGASQAAAACSNCQQALAPTAGFCPNCGTPRNGAAPTGTS
jgi:membrane protease subunit (stomatin/prohibitin family)